MDERAAETAGAVEAARVCFRKPIWRAVFSPAAIYARAAKTVAVPYRLAYLEGYFQQVWREAQRDPTWSYAPHILLYTNEAAEKMPTLTLVEADRRPSAPRHRVPSDHEAGARVIVVEQYAAQAYNGKRRPAQPAGWAVRNTRTRYPTIAKLIVAQENKAKRAACLPRKLTEDQIETITAMRRRGASLRDLAKRFGVTHTAIYYWTDGAGYQRLRRGA